MKSEWNSDPTSPDRPTAGVNVPINKGTLTWDPEHPPEHWQNDRSRWHTYQRVRAILLAVWFLCAVAAIVLS
jgi:hypothetical protein